MFDLFKNVSKNMHTNNQRINGQENEYEGCCLLKQTIRKLLVQQDKFCV